MPPIIFFKFLDISEEKKKKKKKLQEKIEEISGKFWENNINEIIDTFCIKFYGEFRLNYTEKHFIELKFVEHLRKILKTLDYFLLKCRLILNIEVK